MNIELSEVSEYFYLDKKCECSGFLSTIPAESVTKQRTENKKIISSLNNSLGSEFFIFFILIKAPLIFSKNQLYFTSVQARATL